jgi:hypothetical protein
MRLASILLVALLIVIARAAAEGASEPSLRSTGAVHGGGADEAGAEHDAGQSAAAPIEKSGSSAPEERTKPIDPAQHGLLPFIILKSIERPFMMSPPR